MTNEVAIFINYRYEYFNSQLMDELTATVEYFSLSFLTFVTATSRSKLKQKGTDRQTDRQRLKMKAEEAKEQH